MNKLFLVLFLLSTSVFAEDFRENVVLPPCDTTNPTVVIIDSVAGFSQLNDPAKRVFCIKKGDYGNTRLNLTTSGTETEPRYIRYFNPDETSEVHPVNMPEEDKAIVETLYFLGSHHWVVDRITVRAITQYSNVRMQPRLPYNSHWADDVNHIILNRILVENSFGGSGQIAMGGYNLTIQDSVVRDSQVTAAQDDHCIVYYGNNNKVIHNELYNCAGDSIQVGRDLDAVGGVIAFNDMYMRHEWRTDGQGNFMPYSIGATHQCQENAIGFKGGGTPASPLLIKGNKMWNFNREVDHNCATGGGGIFPISISFDLADHIVFEDNIIFDSVMGVVFANAQPNNVTFRNNVFHNVDYAISAPTNKTHSNSFIDNKWSDIEGKPFLNDDVGTVNTVSGNTVLTEQVCFTKYQITNPTEMCIGKGMTQPTQPVNNAAEEIVDAILNLQNLLNNY